MKPTTKARKAARPSFESLEGRVLLATSVSYADALRDVALDSAGNAYALGEFRNVADFDPGSGTAWQTPAPPSASIPRADYIVSYAPDRSLRPGWPVQLPFYTSYLGKPLATGSDGNVYVGGGLNGIGRLAAYDANGSSVWNLNATVTGASNTYFGIFFVTTDANGLYASGVIQGDIQVDLNGDSIVDLTHSSTETDGQFIVKFNLNTHALEWATQIRGDSSHGTPVLASDGQTLYASAGFYGFPGYYGDHVLTGTPFEMTEVDLATYNNVAVDSYIIAIDPATGTITNAAHLIDTEVGSLAVDGTALYAGGRSFVNGPGDLDPGPAQRLIQGGFMARYGTNLSLGWASGLAVGVNDIAVAGGRAYGTGGTSGTVDFDPGSGTYNLATMGQGDGFVWALNANTGTFSWARLFGSTVAAISLSYERDGGAAIAANAQGVYSVGTIGSGPADFDRTASYGDGRDLRSNDTDTDAITLKLDSATGSFGWVNQLGEVHRTIDNGDAGYSETGSGWKNGPGNTPGYLGDVRIHQKGSGSSTARWSFTGLPSGTYDVFAKWFPDSKYATDARYKINGASQALVNQRLAPDDVNDGITGSWKRIGTITITGGTILVELSDQANGTVAADAMRVALTAPAALRAAAVGSGAGTPSSLTVRDVLPLVNAARGRWARLGANVRPLRGLHVRLADLAGDQLAQISGRTLTIDTDAAGRGWFVDATPFRSEEFARGSGKRTVRLASTAKGRYDLLSAISHEMGHALGLGHAEKGVMAETLAPGVRRLPEPRDREHLPIQPSNASLTASRAQGISTGRVQITSDQLSVFYEQAYPGGPTYGKLAEQFFAQFVFPSGGSYGAASVSRNNVVAERVETNGRGGWWLTVRAKYTGSLYGFPVGSDRVRVYYDNGGIRVDLGGIRGAIDTRSIGKWVTNTVQRYWSDAHPDYYKITVKDATSYKLKVYVHFLQTSGAWKTSTYAFSPGESAIIDAKTKNQYIYFRAESTNGKVWASAPNKTINIGNGRTLVMREVKMGSTIGKFTYTFS